MILCNIPSQLLNVHFDLKRRNHIWWDKKYGREYHRTRFGNLEVACVITAELGNIPLVM